MRRRDIMNNEYHIPGYTHPTLHDTLAPMPNRYEAPHKGLFSRLGTKLLTAALLTAPAPFALAQYTASTDQDLDGLSTTYETTITPTHNFTTDPNNPDSDSDGFSDAESVNFSYDPNNPLDPGFGTILFSMTNIEEVLSQNDNYNRVFPIMDQARGQTLAYIRANADWTDPAVCLYDLINGGPETVLVASGVLTSPYTFRQIAFGPNNNTIVYEDGGNAYAVELDGSPTYQLTSFDGATVRLLNPEVLKEGSTFWLLFAYRNGGTNSISTYPFTSDTALDTSTLRVVANLQGGWNAAQNYPRASRNGDDFMFSTTVTNTINRSFFANGLDAILNNTSLPITASPATPDARPTQNGFNNNSPHYSSDVGRTGVVVMTVDRDGTTFSDISSPELSGVDYDIQVAFGPQNTRIPFVGNQLSATIDRRGSRVFFASDFNPYNIPKSNQGLFSLLAANLGSGGSFAGVTGSTTTSVEITDASGITLYIPDGTPLTFPASEEHTIGIQNDSILPVSQAANYPTSPLVLNQRFTPAGTSFTSPPGAALFALDGPGGVLTIPVDDEDLGGTPITDAQIVHYDAATDTATPIPTTVDEQAMTLESTVLGFSGYGVLLPGPTASSTWNLYR